MRRLVTSIFVLSFFAYAGGTAAYAQGRGGGHVPDGDQHTGAGTSHSDHGKSSDHDAAGTKDQTVQSRIESNPQLNAKIKNLLPTNMDLKTAAMGFQNLGQFIAALHVYKNLNIPFDQLQAKLTGQPHVSLGKAIQELRPALTDKEAKEAAEKAEKQAKEDTEKTGPLT